MRDNEKEDARKRGGADKRGGAHSRYQFFRCGKIGGGGADKRWGALWRYSTVFTFAKIPKQATLHKRFRTLVIWYM